MERAVFILGFGGIGQHGLRRFQTYALHGFAEQFTVFRHVDGFRLGTDELHIEFFEHTHFVEGECSVQCCLTTHCGKECIRPFFLDDLCNHFRCNGFDVSRVRQIRVGHDGGRIGIDEDDAITFGFEGLAGLGAGIIKLARLTYDNRSSPDDENGFYICTFWHMRGTLIWGFLHSRRRDSKLFP